MGLVTNGRIAGYRWRPGKNAGYRAGRVLGWGGARHQTVGRYGGDSSIGLRGTFQCYAPRSMPWEQYAEVWAVNYHACEWNQELSALEVEWLPGERFTAHQIDGCGLWVAALVELGVPLVNLRRAGTARYAIGEYIRGFVDHGDLQHKSCDQHTDGWELEWPAIQARALQYLGQSPALTESDPMEIFPTAVTDDGTEITATVGAEKVVWVTVRRPDGSYEPGAKPEHGHWRTIGGQCTSSLTVTANGDQATVRVRGAEGNLWCRTYDADEGAWGDWVTTGGAIVAPPTVPAR